MRPHQLTLTDAREPAGDPAGEPVTVGVRVMYRCDRCEAARRRAGEANPTQAERVTYHVLRQPIRLPSGQLAWLETWDGSPMGSWGHVPRRACRRCHRPMRGDRMIGRTNRARRCGSRCQGATGPSCECACGGTNHGAMWG